MKTGIFLLAALILLNDNRCLFSDAKPTAGSRGECGKGQFYNSYINKCMPCSDTCKISEELCRRHDCLAPPKVQVKSRKTNVTENESVQLECVTSGGIPEGIKHYKWLWKKSDSTPDQVLQDTDTKTSTGNGKVLVFSRIRYDQSGTYTCRAWNIAGMGQGSIDLNVLYSPRIPPGLEKSDVIGEMGKEVSFELSIIANPTPATTDYVWSRGDKRLLATSPDYAIFSGPTRSKLVIKKVTSYDYTNYVCSVHTHGFQAKVFKFRLLNAAPKISIISVSREDTNVTIRWQQVIGHYTAIKIKYCQTGTEHCEYYITQSPEDTSATLFVHPDKTYYYYVMIENGGDVVYTSDRLVAKKVIAAKMSAIGVSRTDNVVTIRWQQVIGRYTAIKIKYCQTGTTSCVDYIVPNPEDTSATWFVDPDKTYYYYMVIEDDGDVVYTSNPLVVNDAKINIVAVVGGSVTGAVILTASGVILAVAIWKSNRSRRKLKNHVTNYTNDDDVSRTALDAIKNSPRHTYANIATASVNHALSHSALRMAEKYPVNPRAKMLYVPANRVRFDDVQSASSHDDEDIDQYDYAHARWLRNTSGSRQSPVPACQTSHPTLELEAAAQIHVPAHQGNQSDPASTASSYQDRQDSKQRVSSRKQRETEPKGAGKAVQTDVTLGQHHQSTSAGGLGQVTLHHNASCQNLVTTPQVDQDDLMDASSNEDESGQNVSEDSSYDDVIIVTQGEPAHSTTEGCLNQETWQHKEIHEFRPYVVCEKQMGQEPEGTYNDVRIITHGLAVGGLGQARLAKKLTEGRPNDDVANDQLSHYEHLEPGPLEPVSSHEYLDFMGLSPKQLNSQM